MVYTVKQVAKISGVTIRTLHHYDHIGLLKPAYHAVNGYRIYTEKEMLILQQILFFRELEIPLKKIQEIIQQGEFSKSAALLQHRKFLEEKLSRHKKLIQTIDKTLMHLDGKQSMKENEFYEGFDPVKQKEYEKYIIKAHGLKGERLLEESKKRSAKWDKTDWESVKEEGDQLHKALSKAIESGASPDSDEVQALVKRHFEMQGRYFDLTKQVYLELGKLYSEHPDFKRFFDVYHQDMIPFLQSAMRKFAETNL